jgi:hypothetical protein
VFKNEHYIYFICRSKYALFFTSLFQQIIMADVSEMVRHSLLKAVLMFADRYLDVKEKRQLLRNRSAINAPGNFQRRNFPPKSVPEEVTHREKEYVSNKI